MAMTFKDFLVEYHGYAKPHTQNERKQNAASGDGEPPVRAKRRKLPSTYDDKPVGNSHNWKKQRKTQYKAA